MEIKGETIVDAWKKGLKVVISQEGFIPTQRKNAHTKEILNVQLIVSNPLKGLDDIPDLEKKRKFDIDSVSNELYWDMMVNAKLTNFKSGEKEIDQIDTICKRLEVKYNRQAYATIWSPEIDTVSAHPVCILGVYFYIRQEKLNMVGILRSNDAWGQGLNDMYHLVRIQQKVAKRLNIEVGTYTHYVMSLHIYDKDLIPARKYALKRKKTNNATKDSNESKIL